MVKVVTFTGTFPYTGKYGISAVLGCNVTNQLLNEDGLAYTRTSEESDFTTLLIRAEKIDNLDTCFKYLNRNILLFKLRSRSVYIPSLS